MCAQLGLWALPSGSQNSEPDLLSKAAHPMRHGRWQQSSAARGMPGCCLCPLELAFPCLCPAEQPSVGSQAAGAPLLPVQPRGQQRVLPVLRRFAGAAASINLFVVKQIPC